MGRCVWAVELNLSLTIVRQGVWLSALANSLAPTVRCQRRSLSLGCAREARLTIIVWRHPHIYFKGGWRHINDEMFKGIGIMFPMKVKSMLVGFLIAVVASTGTYFLMPPPRDLQFESKSCQFESKIR